jgi:acyl-CoA thioesterase FadM
MPEPKPVSDDAAAGLLWLHRAVIRPEWVDYNGHMNEAYYVLIFGDATDAFYDHIGFDAAFRDRENVSAYTLESHIRYLVETHEGEAVRIATRVLSHDARRVRLHHAMLRDDGGGIVSVIELLAMHVDKTVVRSSPFHAGPMARIAAIAAAQASLPPPEPAVSSHWSRAASR